MTTMLEAGRAAYTGLLVQHPPRPRTYLPGWGCCAGTWGGLGRAPHQASLGSLGPAWRGEAPKVLQGVSGRRISSQWRRTVKKCLLEDPKAWSRNNAVGVGATCVWPSPGAPPANSCSCFKTQLQRPLSLGQSCLHPCRGAFLSAPAASPLHPSGTCPGGPVISCRLSCFPCGHQALSAAVFLRGGSHVQNAVVLAKCRFPACSPLPRQSRSGPDTCCVRGPEQELQGHPGGLPHAAPGWRWWKRLRGWPSARPSDSPSPGLGHPAGWPCGLVGDSRWVVFSWSQHCGYCPPPPPSGRTDPHLESDGSR